MDEWQVKTEACGDGTYRWLHKLADGGNAHRSGERFATAEAAQVAGAAALVQHHKREGREAADTYAFARFTAPRIARRTGKSRGGPATVADAWFA
ncbi:hypothetical protein [Variovorax guangxiensis]|uniref:hypothetical protein n=1 Tax=Variovorax guangxiensis TaxID=1775474 RepID=UPI0028663D2C|nr:hypothetical protein [Variovorax guangxiensis]MDR6861374.1 hypothetical protein [Variovorax guangxiensis]